MARRPRTIPSNRPTDAEIDILNILWDRGPSTVRQVHDVLALAKPCQYTTTLKLMQILIDKALLDRSTVDGSHIYHPRIAREQAQREMAVHLMERAFGGSAYHLIVGALSAQPASEQELEDLGKLIRQYRKGARK